MRVPIRATQLRPLPFPPLTITPIPRRHPLPTITATRPLTTTPGLRIHRKEKGDKYSPAHEPHAQKHQQHEPVSPEERERVLERTRAKIDKVVDWVRVVVYDGVERAHGRLSPGESVGTKL